MKKDHLETSLFNDGYYILNNIFNPSQLSAYRKKIFDYIYLFPNTRPSPNSRHLAGFHRYDELKEIDCDIRSHDQIKSFFDLVDHKEQWIPIGLTDITINRSQHWHTDLLRGKYESHLNLDHVYSEDGGGVYKILLYLQEGKNLKVIPGSHKVFSPLDDNASESFASKNNVKTLKLNQGDIIIMDIRLQHRGAIENEMMSKALDDNAKILISTVIGRSSKDLTHQMISGNTHRQADWDLKYL